MRKFLERLFLWLDTIGQTEESRKLTEREQQFIMGNSIGISEAETVVFGLVRDECPCCGTRIETTDEMQNSLMYLWSCENRDCGTQYFITRSHGHKLVDHAPRRFWPEDHESPSKP